MEQRNGNQGQNKGLIDTNLSLGLPQFHKDHQDPMPQQGRVCVECGEAGTPTWRRGPEGRGTLCNACGLKYMRKSKAGSTSEAAN